MGKGMIVASWLLLLGLLTLLFDGILDKQRNPNRQPQAIEDAGTVGVSLQRNRQGHYLASGEVNGREVTFLVDTGATDIAVPEGLALQLGLRKGIQLNSSTANGWTQAWSTVIDEVRLGPIVRHKVQASILPNMSDSEILLGMSFLREMELVQRDGKLRITAFKTE